MKKRYLLSVLFLFAACINTVRAQMVGTQEFLQGKYLEIGLSNNGAFGACPPFPAGYHYHCPGCTMGFQMGYDWGHDGWAVGAPVAMGDYTEPGTPFEGWEVQINGVRSQAMQGNFALNCPGTFSGGTLTGTNTGYSNSGGRAIGTWTGTCAGLQITQQTRVDTLASWVVVTTKFVNPGPGAANAVYYLRSTDPDNDQSWPGGAFSTTNTIVFQNNLPSHKVLVRALGGGYPAVADYLALGTKDCRAKCFSYSGWPMAITNDLANVWNGTLAGGIFNVGQQHVNFDNGIGLVYKLGNIAAGDSAILSYAYIFNNDNGLDSAFPEPQLSVNGFIFPPTAPPTPERDTINLCGTSITQAIVNILNASDKNWSWSTWTWSPALGLASTTGVTNTINTAVLPPTYTYTITGTDSASGMTNCLNKVFLLTIKSCNNVSVNTPCVGDSLIMKSLGDSTGATYTWYGPNSWTTVAGTGQYLIKYPSSWADTGLYRVIKVKAGIADTGYIDARLNPLPTITGSLLICQGATTLLSSNVAGTTWTSVNTSVATVGLATGLVSSGNVGTSTIIATTPAGCKATAVVTVFVLPAIPPQTVCQGSDVQFTAPVSGGAWISVTGTVATINSSGLAHGVSGGTSQISYIAGGCHVETTINVNPTSPITGVAEICQYFTTTFTDLLPGGTWTSQNTSIATINPSTGVIYGVAAGVDSIFYTLPTGCRVGKTITVHPKPAKPDVSDAAICQFAVAVPVSATPSPGGTLTWYGHGVTAGYALPPIPSTDAPAVFNYFVTQTSTHGCISDSAAITITIKPQPPAPTVSDITMCEQPLVDPQPLTATGWPGATFTWYPSLTSTSPWAAPPSIKNLTAGNYTYYVSQTLNGCEGPRAPVVVKVIYKPNFTITGDGKVCQGEVLSFAYNGPTLINPIFTWTLPVGAVPVNGTGIYNQSIDVRFDTAWGKHILYLKAANLGGQCETTVPIEVNVVTTPAAYAFTPHDVCVGDTVALALTTRSTNAEEFNWWIDDVVMKTSPNINIVTADWRSSGPYRIRWNNAGQHIIKVKAIADSECPALITADTVKVHELPDATFKYTTIRQKVCLEDSILFVANKVDYKNSYTWTPAHYFDNMNKPVQWGRVGELKSVVMLSVTDPFGCIGRETVEINPESCCKVVMPTAFSPNNDGKNDRFHPLFQGYHRFHTFRITNRWGQLVWETTNSEPSWDGTFNGVPQDMGVYFYYLKYDCGGKTLEEKGECTLVR